MEQIINNLQAYLAGNSLMALPASFLAGLLISFTPCVYPIIPIQLGFIGGRTATKLGSQNESKFSFEGMRLSAIFVIGMSFVYAGLGAFASLTGALFGSWASSPWTYIVLGNVFLVLSLSMFDVFQIQAPQFLMRLNPKNRKRGYVSALLVGAVSGLVVGPCTAPALGATFAYVGTQQNVIFGTLVLFVFALGMGTLMIVLGSFSGAMSMLPRSGPWMSKIKTAFGVLMLALSQYLFVQAGMRFI
ncbi:MAG: cytochrome c biogenesis protein CcdA [Pyrinomonadaceae bacterium]